MADEYAQPKYGLHDGESVARHSRVPLYRMQICRPKQRPTIQSSSAAASTHRFYSRGSTVAVDEARRSRARKEEAERNARQGLKSQSGSRVAGCSEQSLTKGVESRVISNSSRVYTAKGVRLRRRLSPNCTRRHHQNTSRIHTSH
jgi:hypothetical protein